jgi:DNA-binding MarR family transcriptional regulator
MSANNYSQKIKSTSLHQLTFVLQHLLDELLLSKANVGLSQVRIMGALHKSAPRSQRAVAGQLMQTEANISRQLRLMHKQGLVSIKKNKKDGRQRDVVLTAKGAKKQDVAEKLLAAQQKQLLNTLDRKEVQVFERATTNLVMALHMASISQQK